MEWTGSELDGSNAKILLQGRKRRVEDRKASSLFQVPTSFTHPEQCESLEASGLAVKQRAPGKVARIWCILISVWVVGSFLITVCNAGWGRGGKATSSPSTGSECYYKILGVKREASIADIKKAYRKKSIQYHPDRNKDAGASETFTKIVTAHEILTDVEKRKAYDENGEEGLRRLQQQGDASYDMDPFSSFFDPFGFGSNHQRKEKVPPIIVKLYLSLNQLYFGQLLEVELNRPVVCARANECMIIQKHCAGPGVKIVTQTFGAGLFVQNQISDDSCVDKNKGWKDKCKSCPKGKTEIQTSHSKIYVEPGMFDQEAITLEGHGVERLGHDAGDVIFRVVQIPHPYYDRSGSNLFTTIYVTLLEALVGFVKSYPHPSKKPLVIRRSGVTHDGEVEIIKERGTPMRISGGSHTVTSVDFGDLHITYRVQYPVELKSDVKEILKTALQNVTSWKFEVPKA